MLYALAHMNAKNSQKPFHELLEWIGTHHSRYATSQVGQVLIMLVNHINQHQSLRADTKKKIRRGKIIRFLHEIPPKQSYTFFDGKIKIQAQTARIFTLYVFESHQMITINLDSGTSMSPRKTITVCDDKVSNIPSIPISSMKTTTISAPCSPCGSQDTINGQLKIHTSPETNHTERNNNNNNRTSSFDAGILMKSLDTIHDSFKHVDFVEDTPEQQIQKLKRKVDELTAENDEKDEHIRKLNVSLKTALQTFSKTTIGKQIDENRGLVLKNQQLQDELNELKEQHKLALQEAKKNGYREASIEFESMMNIADKKWNSEVLISRGRRNTLNGDTRHSRPQKDGGDE